MTSKIRIIILFVFISFTFLTSAQNPIIQTKYTADPAPLVYNDTVFLYTSHDEDNAGPGMGKFLMKDWLLYTSVDMVNWTDHGVVASLKDFTWGNQDNGAWAPQCVARDGKFYLYCPVQGSGIGVLVSNSPYGPFKDPLGRRLIEDDHIWNDIDPTVIIDDDGQAYLYWGNPSLWYVKLNKDMISFSGEVMKVPGVGKEQDQKDPDAYHYQEGPWAYKHNDHYYIAYASTCCPEGIGYAMADKPTGPWDYKGYIMKPNEKSSGNHPGIIDYKGKTYVFGFNFRLNFMITENHHERRSVCVEELNFNPDGTIIELPWWSETGVKPIGQLNPFKRTEAETIAWSQGLKTAKSSNGIYVTAIDNGDYIKVQAVDFGKNVKNFEVTIASLSTDAAIEVHLDSPTGRLLGTLKIKNTGGNDKWASQSCPIKKEAGVHDIYLVFKGTGKDLFSFDWWKFNK
ncbi:MAG: glycoside hydrolase family 43 protein [Flavobacterium sp.]|nr:glycoside hydrolase family 43 protein [Flavobacterium sp.]